MARLEKSECHQLVKFAHFMQPYISLPSHVSVLSQTNPLPSCRPVSATSAPMSYRWCPFRLPNSKPCVHFPSPLTCHMPNPPRPPLFNHSDNIQIALQIVKRRTVQLSPVPCHYATCTYMALTVIFSVLPNLCVPIWP